MSTDLIQTQNRQQFQPIDHWFWPTSNLLSPMMDSNKSQSVNTTNSLVSSNSTPSPGTYHRRHKHWWKVCWIYNNGHFIGNPSKPTQFRQFHQQFSSFSMCSTNMSTIFNDRCVNMDNQIFSTNNKTKSPKSIESEVQGNSDSVQSCEPRQREVSQNKVEEQLFGPTLSMSSCGPTISSSATSGFLQQRVTQPLSALLKQKCEHKNSISQFFIDFKGSEWRAEQLQYQMPVHDIQMFKSQSNEVKFVRNQQRRAQIKPQLFLNKSLNHCFKCTQIIENETFGVKISVAKNGNHNNGYNTTTDDEDSTVLKDKPMDPNHPSLNGSTALYHIQCFTCEECQQVLVDLKAFLHNSSERTDRSIVKSSLYCSRHFVELFKPRCQFCDHLIFDEECTEAEGKAWHLGHFCCSECKRSLGGQQYIMADPSKQNDKTLIQNNKNLSLRERDKQLPYCLTCFDILFGELCEECGELIGCDVGAISHEGRSWHASDQCFKCNLCFKTLLGKPFLPAFDGRIYCSISCSQESIQRNRYRNRRKQRVLTNTNTDHSIALNGNTDLKKLSQNEPRIEEQIRPELQIRENTNFYNQSQRPLDDRLGPNLNGDVLNGNQINVSPNNYNNNNMYRNTEESNVYTQRFSQMNLTEKSLNFDVISSKPNEFQSFESNRISPNITNCETFPTNDLMTKQMFEYLQHQQLGRPPNQIINYMRHQLIQNGVNGQNDIIGAAIECGISLSEDERTNPRIPERKTQITSNDINYNQMTSSTSSSLSANPFETNNNSLKSKPLMNGHLIHSSSSNETTPLLLRSLEERAKQLSQIDGQTKQVSNNRIFEEKSMQSLPKSESPSQNSSQNSSHADHSSNSSYIDSNGRINDSFHIKVTPVSKGTEEMDTPSTQSTALQSTSSQTTPETNPRSPNKSVTFDPSVKETTGRRLKRKPKQRSSKKTEWSDNEWCSTCSSCSSSSSDDNFDYESTLERNRNQWLGGTKIQYVSNDRKKSTPNLMPTNNTQNESCIIA